MYGPCRAALEYERINALLQWEIALRTAEGQDMSRCEIAEEAFEKHYEHKITDFIERFPMLELETMRDGGAYGVARSLMFRTYALALGIDVPSKSLVPGARASAAPLV